MERARADRGTRVLAALLAAAATTACRPPAPAYEVERLNHGRPIVDRAAFAAAGVPEEGANVNGPCLVRVPDWLPPSRRADPAARYYLYFAHHRGTYIRLAWAERPEGPYRLYRSGAAVPVGDRGVLDLGADGEIRLGRGLAVGHHVASPDVHVDHVRRRFLLLFHGPVFVDGERSAQRTLAAFSDDGLDFGGGIVPAVVGWPYLRGFRVGGAVYGLAGGGRLFAAPSGPLFPAAGEDVAATVWREVGNPFGRPRGDVIVRHLALVERDGGFDVLFTRSGDAPEHVRVTRLDVGAADPAAWTVGRSRALLEPELAWEGADLAVAPSRKGPGVAGRALRDPFVFRDADGRLYLLYSGRGEEAIGIARLTPLTAS